MATRPRQLEQQLLAATTDLERSSVIKEVAARRAHRLVPLVARYALGRSATASDARAALSHLLDRAPPLYVMVLEALVRAEGERPGWHPGPTEEQLADLRALRGDPSAWATLGIYSFDRSGYVREPCVRQLGELDDPRVVPFLLLRCGDWVPQVRGAALAAIEQRMHPRWAPALVRALPLVQRLSSRHRAASAGEGGLSAWVLRLLRQPACFPALQEGLSNPDPRCRRALFPLVLELTSAKPEVVRRACGDGDPLVRLWALREAAQTLSSTEALALARGAAADPYAPVRYEALDLISKVAGPVASSDAERALLDESSTIRYLARAILAKHGRSRAELASRYLAALEAVTSTKAVCTAMAALAEVGGEDEGLVVLPSLQDPRARVRAAALRAAGKLLGGAIATDVVSLLADPRARLASDASRFLARHLGPELVPQLERALGQKRGAVGALDALAKQPKWDALRLLLDVLGRPEEKLRRRASTLLVRWVERAARSQRELSPVEAVALQERLAGVEAQLPAGVRDRIALELAFWARPR